VIRLGGAVLVALVGLAGPAVAVEEPDGYRGEPYEAPVPATLEGAVVVDSDAAHALWWSGRVAFVDVLPRAPRPALPPGTIWRDAPHSSVPGAIWLPNTGYEALAPETTRYLLDGLAHVTGGDLSYPVVVFCRQDCWMSWNVAKRAIEHGYTRIYWYPDGVDGWAFEGWPLEQMEPAGP
jgi:PQQ-dependent catabolism-associated CXXCW motif protein